MDVRLGRTAGVAGLVLAAALTLLLVLRPGGAVWVLLLVAVGLATLAGAAAAILGLAGRPGGAVPRAAGAVLLAGSLTVVVAGILATLPAAPPERPSLDVTVLAAPDPDGSVVDGQAESAPGPRSLLVRVVVPGLAAGGQVRADVTAPLVDGGIGLLATRVAAVPADGVARLDLPAATVLGDTVTVRVDAPHRRCVATVDVKRAAGVPELACERRG